MSAPDELTEASALGLVAGRLGIGRKAKARLLPGGVSNTVVLLEDGARRYVVKQSLPRLRVRDKWLADRERVVREWQVMLALRGILPAGRVPEPVFLDRRRFLYVMRAAPPGSSDWKSLLMAGHLSASTARAAGATLGLMARGTWMQSEFRRRFADATAFRQLRTDPYYRTVAARHPRVAGAIERWIEESSLRQCAMVHGDWSPKNLLVGPLGPLCIDFECAHFGDPSYDAAFMLNHLVLKSFYRPELASGYLRLARTGFAWTLGTLPPGALTWYEAAAMRHLAFLMLARVDGKSPVEYLRSEAVRDTVRRLALRLVSDAPSTVTAALRLVRSALEERKRSARATRRP